MAGQLKIAGAVADGSITESKLASSSVTAAKIASGNVDNTALGTNSVSTVKIQDDAVTFAKMQNTSNGARLLGRIDSGGGQIQEQTAAEVRTFLNVADGSIDGSALNASNLSSGTVPDLSLIHI